MEKNMEFDALFFGAHPDDVEISAGGSIAKLVNEGKNVAVVDLTSGEMGTRGSADERIEESEKAANILGIKNRLNLRIKDGYIDSSEENIYKIIQVLRHFKPKIIIMHPSFERHPDHEAAHRLIRKAMFKSGLIKIDTKYNDIKQERFRIRKMFCYMQSYEFTRKPDFYLDISDTIEQKMNSIKAYKTQVFIPGQSAIDNEITTRLYRPEFLDEIESRAKYFGSLIGVRYAEAFVAIEPVGLSSFSKLL
jgi:N-acetylglucosamine malate deacetylase 1